MTMPQVPPFAVTASYQNRQYDQNYDINAAYGSSTLVDPKRSVGVFGALVNPPATGVSAQTAAERVAYNVGFTGYGPQSQVEQVVLTNASGGTFQLAFGGEATTPLDYNAAASAVQSALLALTTVPSPVASVPTVATVSLVDGSSGTPDGGTFTLSFGGQTTAPLAYNATAAAVKKALQALSSIPAGGVASVVSETDYLPSRAPAGFTYPVNVGGPYTVTFGGSLAQTSSALSGTWSGLAVIAGEASAAGEVAQVNGSAPTPSTQTITVAGSPSAGSFTLTFKGNTTTSLAYNATLAAVQDALRALPTVGPDGVASVTGTAGTSYVVSFGGDLFDTTSALSVTATGVSTGGSITAGSLSVGAGVTALSVAAATGLASGQTGYTVTFGGALQDRFVEPSWEPSLAINASQLSTGATAGVKVITQGRGSFQSWPIAHADEQFDKLRNEWDYGSGNNFSYTPESS